MSDLTIGGETFRVEVAGDPTRPTLMLAHPLGADLTIWDGQLPALTKHFRVIRYDARGHGGSTIGETPGAIAQLAGDALAILDALEIDKVHWLGLSMGGAVGLWLLANAPDRIERTVLANTAPLLGSLDGWNARITDVLANGTEENAATTIERWFSPEFAALAPERVEAVHTVLRNVSPQGYAAACAALRDMDLRETLHAIAHDVLIITGTDDPVVPAADAAAFVAAVPGAKHVALKARHLSNIEAEAAFNAAIVTFLTAKATPRPGKASPRKAASVEAVPAKRGGASRRSNAARSPLKKAPAKKTAAKKAPPKKAAAKKAATTTRRVKAKTSSTRRGATPKTAPKTAPRKTKAAAKSTVKSASARRPTSTAAARGPVKKAVPKKPAKRAVTKTPTKKATPKVAAKKLPGARRRTTKKAGRPTGRRKT